MFQKKIIYILFFSFSILLIAACEKLLPPAPAEEELLAGTVPGLTAQQERDHLAGDELFGKIFSAEDGLGPIFVQNSCSNCHVGNGKGHLSTLVTRFGNDEGSSFNYLLEKGGPQLQERSLDGYPAETLPSEANTITKRLAPAVMGLGFIAALHDSSILANSDPNDLNGDGISGIPNYIMAKDYFIPQAIHIANNDQYIGRFGKKAEKITLLDQVAFALREDIGITSPFNEEDIYNTQAGNFTGDDVDDPEVSTSTVNGLVFYMRTLKAPERRNTNDFDVIEGERLFNEIGCTSCHKPAFTTAESDIEALSEKVFHPYSDFLLHDMGSSLDDGYPEGSANSNEWRTPPLWGIGLARTTQGGEMFLLHDGRARSFEEALSFHGGEAESRRSAFFQLTKEQQQQIIKFLESL